MNKFTIFTIILAVSVITVTVDLGVRDYFEKNSEASVLDATSDEPETIVVPPEQPEPSEPVFPISPPDAYE